MEQYLIHMTTLRRIEPRELQDALIHLAKEKTEQIWLLTLSGKRRLVRDVNEFTPERWQVFAQRGLVYAVWGEQWAFAADMDHKTKLPVLLETYEDAYRKVEANKVPPSPAPAQPTLLDQPAEQATTQPS
jgi:hypothetical protein